MKIEPGLPPRPTPARKTGSTQTPVQTPARPADARHDNSFHSPDDIRVDIVRPADADSHEGPDFHGADDADLLDRDGALETAQTVGAWLADHALSLSSHRGARLQHLFAG